MAQEKPIPLVGRLAIQLKMLTPQEVARAMAESESTGNPRLAQVMLQMGMLDREQVAKLQQVQKDLVEKQRARTAGETPESAASPVPTPAPAGTPQRRANEVHRAAEHAAKAAAPMTSRDTGTPGFGLGRAGALGPGRSDRANPGRAGPHRTGSARP